MRLDGGVSLLSRITARSYGRVLSMSPPSCHFMVVVSEVRRALLPGSGGLHRRKSCVPHHVYQGAHLHRPVAVSATDVAHKCLRPHDFMKALAIPDLARSYLLFRRLSSEDTAVECRSGFGVYVSSPLWISKFDRKQSNNTRTFDLE